MVGDNINEMIPAHYQIQGHTTHDQELLRSISYLEAKPDLKPWYGTQSFENLSQMYWYIDEKECFVPCQLMSVSDDVATVQVYRRNDTVQCTVDHSLLQKMNPLNLEMCEDMTNLTYLNDASVLHNICRRYSVNLIHTYSGLFCITVNPYKNIPIYTTKVMSLYVTSQRHERPPHLFAVANSMLTNIYRDKENQSILITGESGSGKTENTKRLIQYVAHVASSLERKGGSEHLEDKIISANPLMESYGNAKTSRNNNSSRFGKYIRIHFSTTGIICGADIDTYLLEKSRVTFAHRKERSYHIFYQLTSGGIPNLCKELLIEPKSESYIFINHGVLTAETIDDAEDMRNTDSAIDILGFPPEDKLNMYKITAAIMIFGNCRWKQRQRREQAEADGTEDIEKVSYLLGVETLDLVQAILQPRMRVGTEYVNRGQSQEQVISAVAALSKSIYDRLFRWIIKQINITLKHNCPQKKYHIGILDIAGFEIFEINDFEQLCINYTNERLQQFFNHHMFVLEQEEYKNEHLDWQFIDFGLDLQPCIDLIEKPVGIFSILEEECILPKSTDASFLGKVMAYHGRKHPNLGIPKGQKGQHQLLLVIRHYAGLVQYNISGWLEKNRDPINLSAATLFKQAKNPIMVDLFVDLQNDDGKQKKRIKGGSMSTLSAIHKEGLIRLTNNLSCTFPHFVRCIIPNESKKAGVFDRPLVLHQLKCNGVLEGIRICRKGFPNRMLYSEFKRRYSITCPTTCYDGYIHAKEATRKILGLLGISNESYRLGNTKVFFKSGIAGYLEDMRNNALGKIVCLLQSRIRSYLIQKKFIYMRKRINAVTVLQFNLKSYIEIRSWAWWNLFNRLRPMLAFTRKEEEFRIVQENNNTLKANIVQIETHLGKANEQLGQLQLERGELLVEIENQKQSKAMLSDEISKLIVNRSEIQSHQVELEEELREQESSNKTLQNTIEQLNTAVEQNRSTIELHETNINNLKIYIKQLEESIESMKRKHNALEKEYEYAKAHEHQLESEIRTLKDELEAQMNKNRLSKKTMLKNDNTIREDIRQLETNLRQEQKQLTNLLQEIDKLKLERDNFRRALDAAFSEITKLKQTNVNLVEQKVRLENTNRNQCEILELSQERVVQLELQVNTLDQKNAGQILEIESYEKANNIHVDKLYKLQTELDDQQHDMEIIKDQYLQICREKEDLQHQNEQLNTTIGTLGVSSLNKEAIQILKSELLQMKCELEKSEKAHRQQLETLKSKWTNEIIEKRKDIRQLETNLRQEQKQRTNLLQEIDKLKLERDNFRRALDAAAENVKLAKQEFQSSNEAMQLLQSQLEDQRHINTTSNKVLDAVNMKLAVALENEGQFEETIRKLHEEISSWKSEVDLLQKSLRDTTHQLKNLEMACSIERQTKDEEISKNIELTNIVAALQLERENMRTEFCQTMKEKDNQIIDIRDQLGNQSKKADKEIEDLLNELAMYKRKISNLEREIEDEKIDTERNNSKLGILENKERISKTTIAELISLIDTMKSEIEDDRMRCKQMESALDTCKHQLANSEAKIEPYKADIKRYADDNQELKAELESWKKAGRKHKQEIATLTDKLAGKTEQLEEMIRNDQIQRLTIDSLRSEVQTGKNEISRVTSLFQAQMKEEGSKHDTEKVGLVNELEKLMKKYNNFERSKKSTEDELNHQLKISGSLTDEIADLKKFCRSKDQSMAALISDLHVSNEQVQKLTNELNCRNTVIKQMVNDLDNLNLTKINLEDNLSKAEESLLRSESELEKVLHDHVDSENRNKELQLTIKDTVEQMENEKVSMNEIVNKMQMYKDSNMKLEQKLLNLSEKINQLEDVKTELTRHLRNTQEELNGLQISFDNERRKITRAHHKEVNDLTHQCDDLKQKITDMTKMSKFFEKQTKDYQLKLTEMENALNAKDELVSCLHGKMQSYKRQNAEIDEVAEANLLKYRKAIKEVQQANARADQADAEVSRLRIRNRYSACRQSTSPGGLDENYK